MGLAVALASLLLTFAYGVSDFVVAVVIFIPIFIPIFFYKSG